MASLQGNQNTGVINTNSIIKKDMSLLYELEADATPLVALTQKLNKVRTVDNPQFHAIELRPLAQSSLCSAYLVGATSVTVVDASIYNVDDRIINLRTGENLLITAINYGTNALTVTRAIGSTAAAAGNDNDTILRLGQAVPEASSMPVAVLAQESVDYNYTEIFRESYSVSGTLKSTALYTGDRVKQCIQQCMRKVKGDMEMAAFFGERGIQNASTAPRRFTRGLKAVITTNSYNPAGTLSESAFAQNVLVPAGRYGSRQKILFAGENLMRCFDTWGVNKLNLYTDDNSLGFRATLYRSSFVDLVIVRHQLFRGTDLAKKGFIVDPQNMRRVALRGREMHWDKNIQAPDYDGEAGSILAEIGWEFTLEETHMAIDGVTGPA